MAVTITPVLPQSAVLPVAPGDAPAQVLLRPGTVISAQVVEALQNGLVQIAIDGMVIAAFSEVPLQVGTTLQLAVSAVQDGLVKLGIVPTNGAARSPLQPAVAVPTGSAATNALSTANADPSVLSTALPEVVDDRAMPQAAAIATATLALVPRQQSLAPLFANLPQVAISAEAPVAVQQSAANLLALRPELSPALTADDLRTAFTQSGVLLEAKLAAGHVVVPSADVKAALLAFREALSDWSMTSSGNVQTEPSSGNVQTELTAAQASRPAQALAEAAPETPASQRMVSAAFSAIPAGETRVVTDFAVDLATAAPVEAGALPPSRQPAQPASLAAVTMAQEVLGAPVESPAAIPTPTSSLPQPARTSAQAEIPASASLTAEPQASLAFIRDPAQALQAVLRVARALAPFPEPVAVQVEATQRSQPPVVQPTPPPWKDAAPSAQAIAAPTLPADAAPRAILQHLVEQTDAGLARQTLLQIASLPDRSDAAAFAFDPQSKSNGVAPRWHFEIPFATPQGTAVAQFQIDGEGGDAQAADPVKRIWRARFSLNVEPTGPVHALISRIGDKTAVRLWAERSETAAQMRANADQLRQALHAAALNPGELAIADGLPAQQSTPRAGRLLDRAS